MVETQMGLEATLIDTRRDLKKCHGNSYGSTTTGVSFDLFHGL